MRGGRESACGSAQCWNVARRALLTLTALPVLVGALPGCQFVAGLDEDRAIKPSPQDGTGGSPTSGEPDGGAGEGGAPPDKVPSCTVERARQASQSMTGNPALVYAGGRYDLAWPYYSSGVA